MLETNAATEITSMESGTPDRRVVLRERLEGPAEVCCEEPRLRTRASTIDLHEGGLSLLCAAAPPVGAWLHIDVIGIILEGRVRHVAPEGVLWRIGVETP